MRRAIRALPIAWWKRKARLERPAILEGVEAARRHLPCPRHALWSFAPPDGVEGRDARARDRPSGRVRPDQPGPARSEDPLVAAGDEHVAAQRGGRLVVDSE